MTTRINIMVALVCTLSLAAVPVVRADDEPSLDDLLNLPKAPAGDKADANAKPGDKKLVIDPSVLEEELSPEEAADAFKAAIHDMGKVAVRLDAQLDPGLDTQRMQESILAKLDKVLAAAKKNQGGKSGKGSGQSKPGQAKPQQNGSKQNAGKSGQKAGTKPGSKPSSHPSQGPGGKGDVKQGKTGGALDENRSEWGHLPARLRDELIQGRDDKFSATYKSLTQEYYRRLAQEGR